MTNSAVDTDADAARRHILLTEVFGVHPRAIVDELVVSANEHLYIRGSQLEETVYDVLNDNEHADKAAEEGVHAINTLLEHAIDHTMDTFELYCLRSIFVITPEQSQYMTMAHHRGLDLRPVEQVNNETSSESIALQLPVVPDLEDQLQRQIACSFCTKTNEDALPAVINTADDVLSQVYSVMEAIDSLMGAEPLTVAFSTEAPYHTQTNDDDVPVDTRREWEKGRDEYLNWEAQRIIASMKR